LHPALSMHRILLVALWCLVGPWRADGASRTLAELPLQYREGLLWVELHPAPGEEPLHFLIDSGASKSVVHLPIAHQLGLELGSKVRVKAVGQTVTGYWPVRWAPTVRSEISLPTKYLALDLSKLSDACHRPVHGLLGADFLRDRIVQIDYTRERLKILEPSSEYQATNSVTLRIRPGGFSVEVNVNQTPPHWVRVDTGCVTALQWVTSLEPDRSRITKAAVGLADLSIPQIMTQLQLGHNLLENVPTGLHRQAIFPGESGLIGNELLARFGVVTIDTLAGRLVLGDMVTP